MNNTQEDKQMIRENSPSGCVRGRLYYYDFLDEATRTHIPESSLRHILVCRHCQGEIERLRGMLVEQKGDDESDRCRRSAAITSVLKLHFVYAGRSVTCGDVKPLLPSLCDRVLEIRIPTPVTAHVDNCPQCSRDVSILSQMDLSHRQLCRLGRLFADKPEGTGVGCGEALEGVAGVVGGDLSGIGAEALRHLCTCSECRESLYQRREELVEGLLADTADEELSCEGTSLSDLFAYCLPYGVDAADDGVGDLRPEEAAHISGCRRCLSRVQQLHEAVCGIAERPDSGIITRLTVKGQAVEVGEARANWSVNVEVYKSRPEAEPAAEPVTVPERTARKAKRLNFARLLKPAAVAAAAILVVSFLFINAPVAKAVDLSQVYDAIARIRNACISQFGAGKAEPYQKEWVSQSMNIRMFETREEVVLWDIGNGVKKAKSLESGAIETIRPSEALLSKFGDAVANSFGLMPFSRMTDVPEDALWSRVDDTRVAALVPGTEVYDLEWVEDETGCAKKTRFWVDRTRDLPRRVEFYRRDLISGGQHVLTMTIEVEYPADSEIQPLVHSYFN